MKGRIVLLLSLLCVAQALPLILNEEAKPLDLARDKRHNDHTNIADREVRTIISAIVDAILDGDKKKRSDISTETEGEEVEDISGDGTSIRSNLTQDKNEGKEIYNRTVTNSSLFIVESSGDSSGSGVESGDELTVESSAENPNESNSGSGAEDNKSGDFGKNRGEETLIVEEQDVKNSQPTSPNTARIKREDDLENYEDKVKETPNLNNNNKDILLLKRDTETAITNGSNKNGNYDINESGPGVPSKSSDNGTKRGSVNLSGIDESDINEIDKRDRIPDEDNETSIKSHDVNTVFLKNDTKQFTNASDLLGEDATSEEIVDMTDDDSGSSDGGESVYSSGDVQTSADVESGSGSQIVSQISNIPKYQRVDLTPVKPQTATNVEGTITTFVDQENERDESEESQSSGDGKVQSSSNDISVFDEIIEDMAKAAIENTEMDGDNDEDDGETIDSVVKKSIVPFDIEEENIITESLDPNLLVTTEEIKQEIPSELDKRSNLPIEDNDDDIEIGKRSDIPTDENVEIEKPSSIKNHLIYAEQLDTSNLFKQNINNKNIDERIERRSDFPTYPNDYSSLEIDPETRSIINDVERQDKKFIIPNIKKKYKKIIEKERKRAEHVNDKRYSLEEEEEEEKEEEEEDKKKKRTTSSIYNAAPQVQLQKNISLSLNDKPHQKKVNEALFSLVKSILNEDTSTRMKIDRIIYQKMETEEKFERDLIDLLDENAKKNGIEEIDDKTKGNVVTEVKDFEGFIQALSQKRELPLWKHDVIVKKLERDLLNHLSIPESQQPLITDQADELRKISEMDYIKDKILDAKEETNRFGERHARNLQEIKNHAFASLRPIIESLPIDKGDIEDLIHSIGRSAWLRMIAKVKDNHHASMKMRRNLQILLQ